MAAQHLQPFTVNEVVKCKGKICLITDIRNVLGFNEFTLVDIDTGSTLIARRYQMERSDEVAAALLPEFQLSDDHLIATTEDIDMPLLDHDDASDQPDTNSTRWARVTEDDINNLAANRHSHHTGSQTKWAVRLFKGRKLPPCPCSVSVP